MLTFILLFTLIQKMALLNVNYTKANSTIQWPEDIVRNTIFINSTETNQAPF
jgi:hypothetical protein